jgi:hypothetical protein
MIVRYADPQDFETTYDMTVGALFQLLATFFRKLPADGAH